MAAKKSGNQKLCDAVTPSQDWEGMLSQAQVSFYGAFASMSDFSLLKEIIEHTHQICSKNQFTFFKTLIKMSQKKPEASIITHTATGIFSTFKRF